MSQIQGFVVYPQLQLQQEKVLQFTFNKKTLTSH